GARGSGWSGCCATRSTIGGATSGASPDGPPCRDPGGWQWDPALAAFAREVAQTPAHAARWQILAAVDTRARDTPDGERLCRDRTVAGEEHPGAAAPACGRTIHRRTRAPRHRLRARPGRAPDRGAGA